MLICSTDKKLRTRPDHSENGLRMSPWLGSCRVLIGFDPIWNIRPSRLVVVVLDGHLLNLTYLYIYRRPACQV